MKLHILTAVTRLQNLGLMHDSIVAALGRARHVKPEWHKHYDHLHQNVGGQKLKNDMLNEITDGWVCILDDDTLMHPRFLQKIEIAVATIPLTPLLTQAIVVSQRRVNGTVLRAAPENMVVGKVDAGQAVLRRDLIGDARIPETYAGDGMWLEELLAGRHDVHYMSEVLSLHNAISGIDVGPQEVEA